MYVCCGIHVLPVRHHVYDVREEVGSGLEEKFWEGVTGKEP